MRKFFLVVKYIALYYVSYTLILFAIVKILGIQFRVKNFEEYTQLRDLGNFQLAWAFFGRSYTYNLFLGIIEIIAASLILFKRSRLIGLLLSLGIYTNIVLIDFEYEVNALHHAVIEFIIILIWLYPYLNDLKKYLWDMGGRFVNSQEDKNKLFTVYFPFAFIILISSLGFYLRSGDLVPANKIIGTYKIVELSVNGKKLELGRGKYTKDPLLFFEFKDAFVLSANDSSYSGKYEIKADSIFVSFNRFFKDIQSVKGKMLNSCVTIQGITNNGQSFEIHIQKKNQNE
jgi:hypothetical protein